MHLQIAFLQTMNKQSIVAAAGINAETLTMIRTRFILDWFHDYAAKFPFRLFELQRQLLQEGMFDAYNQWIFGTAQNLAAYQNWTILIQQIIMNSPVFKKAGYLSCLPPILQVLILKYSLHKLLKHFVF